MIKKYVSLSDGTREERASVFIQMLMARDVIRYKEDSIIDKSAFEEFSLSMILNGAADHIEDPEVRFELLTRLFFEHGAL